MNFDETEEDLGEKPKMGNAEMWGFYNGKKKISVLNQEVSIYKRNQNTLLTIEQNLEKTLTFQCQKKNPRCFDNLLKKTNKRD